MSDDTLVLRVDRFFLWTLWVMLFLSAGLVGFLVAVSVWGTAAHEEPWIAAALIAWFSISSVIFALMARNCGYRIQISDDSITKFGPGKRSTTVRWTDIRTFKLRRVTGVVVITGSEGDRIMVDIQLECFRQFVEIIVLLSDTDLDVVWF